MADTPDAPATPEKYPRTAALIWKIVNLGIPALVLLAAYIDHQLILAFFTGLAGFAVILLLNLWLSWRLSRGRIGPCIGIYLGSVLLGCGLTFLGCMVFSEGLRS